MEFTPSFTKYFIKDFGLEQKTFKIHGYDHTSSEIFQKLLEDQKNFQNTREDSKKEFNML